MPNERHYNNELNLESVGINQPFNMQAEQSVLGAVLLKPDTLTDLVEIIKPEMFYTRQNAQIWSEMLRLFTNDQTIDFVTLLDAVISDGVFPSADEAKVYLTGLAETVPSISNVKAYAQIVQEKYLVRQLMDVAKDILQDAGDEPDADLLLDLLCNLVQNAAKALMIRHEQRVGLMDRDWHPFEARMAPMLNAIGLHFATEGFTPAKRGHAKNFLAWGYFQGADYFKDQAETIRAELLPIENPEHGFTAAAAAFAREIEASPFPVCLHWRCGDYLLPQNAALQVCTPEYYAAACRTVRQSLPQAELFVFSDDPAYVRQHLDAAGLPVHYSTGAKSAAADLALMRRCRAFVLSNSTFSWWGQWLAGVPGRCVIAPDRWYANGKKTALYDHDWTLIPTK